MGKKGGKNNYRSWKFGVVENAAGQGAKEKRKKFLAGVVG